MRLFLFKKRGDHGSIKKNVSSCAVVREKKSGYVRTQEIFHELQEEFSTPLKARNIDWIESGCAQEIHADRLAIVRALRNLVSNSIEHGGNDLSRIEVGCTESDGFHVFFVKDDGNGLNENCRHEIFEP